MSVGLKVIGLVASLLSLGVSAFFYNLAYKAYHTDRAFAESDELLPSLLVRAARWAFRTFKWLKKLMGWWVVASLLALLIFLFISFVIPI